MQGKSRFPVDKSPASSHFPMDKVGLLSHFPMDSSVFCTSSIKWTLKMGDMSAIGNHLSRGDNKSYRSI